jgi:hypothetical protein
MEVENIMYVPSRVKIREAHVSLASDFAVEVWVKLLKLQAFF